MPDEDPYIGTNEVADLIGVQAATVRLYLKRTRKRLADDLPVRPQDLPEPEIVINRSPAWRESTIRRWQANRPGRGRRA